MTDQIHPWTSSDQIRID